MEQISWIFLYHDIDRIHQPLEVALLDEQEFCVVCMGEMFEALQVRLPIADVLIIETVHPDKAS